VHLELRFVKSGSDAAERTKSPTPVLEIHHSHVDVLSVT
jgi:hypothetical protein